MQKALWSSVVTCALLVGCAAMYPRIERASKQQDCASGNECIIAVNVACTRFHGCELSVDADLILVKERGKSTNIVWRLTGDTGASFPSNGVVVDSSEFECGAKPETKEFTCSDKHADFGVFKYRINVTVPESLFGARGVPSLDPWIVNN
ncbi:MAG: hypothetical protein M3R40_06405 [Pseudomonadota bacterium]|nr:hypothetical protein [Pseudomonadota bacterium]